MSRQLKDSSDRLHKIIETTEKIVELIQEGNS